MEKCKLTDISDKDTVMFLDDKANIISTVKDLLACCFDCPEEDTCSQAIHKFRKITNALPINKKTNG